MSTYRPKGTPITPEFRARLEAAAKGRTYKSLLRAVNAGAQHCLIGRALEGLPLVRKSHDILAAVVAKAEEAQGRVVAARPVPEVKKPTLDAVVHGLLDGLGELAKTPLPLSEARVVSALLGTLRMGYDSKHPVAVRVREIG